MRWGERSSARLATVSTSPSREHETRRLVISRAPDDPGGFGDYDDLAPSEAVARLLDRDRVDDTPTLGSGQLEPEIVPSIGDER